MEKDRDLIIDDFIITEESLGGAVNVRKAIERSTGHVYAVKIFYKDKLSYRAYKRIFIEAEIMNKLSDCNRIVKIKKLFEEKDKVCLFMEYLPSGDLATLIESRHLQRLSEIDARKYFIQIIEGVEYAHKKNIVHRDLKLENILLNEDCEIIIIDWGFGAYWKYGTKLDTSCGTLYYASPEILSGQEYTGPEIDVYSLGVVLFTMITGRFPYMGASTSETIQQIIQGNLVFPSYIPADLVDLLTCMMAVNPLHRITLNEVFNHEWIIKGIPIQTKKRTSIISTPKRIPSSSSGGLSVYITDIIIQPSTPEVIEIPQSCKSNETGLRREKKKFSLLKFVNTLANKVVGKSTINEAPLPSSSTSNKLLKITKHARWSSGKLNTHVIKGNVK